MLHAALIQPVMICLLVCLFLLHSKEARGRAGGTLLHTQLEGLLTPGRGLQARVAEPLITIVHSDRRTSCESNVNSSPGGGVAYRR